MDKLPVYYIRELEAPSGRIGKVVLPTLITVTALSAEGCRAIPGRGCSDLYCTRGAQRVLLMRVGVTASQLDLPSLTPMSVAGYGRLQLEVAHWDTLVALMQV